MFGTSADPQSEHMRVRLGSRTCGLIRSTLALGRSIGSLFYLLSVGVIAGWTIAVFFGAGLFFLMPRSAKLEPGLSPAATTSEASSAQTPSLTQTESRSDRLFSQLPPPIANAVANVSPRQSPAEATISHAADELAAQALTLELGTISAATGEAAPMPARPNQLSAVPEPRSASQSSRPRSARKPLEPGPAKTRTAQQHAPVSAIQDVLHKHSRLLK
jgi:hypothetical protein